MAQCVYWCTKCGKSFFEGNVPIRCDECEGDVDHDEIKEDESEYLRFFK